MNKSILLIFCFLLLAGCHSGSGPSTGQPGGNLAGKGFRPADAQAISSLFNSAQISQSVASYADSQPRLRPIKDKVAKSISTFSDLQTTEDFPDSKNPLATSPQAEPNQCQVASVSGTDIANVYCDCNGGSLEFKFNMATITGRQKFPTDGIFLNQVKYGEKLVFSLKASCTELRGEITAEFPIILSSDNPLWFETNPFPSASSDSTAFQRWFESLPNFEVGVGVVIKGQITGSTIVKNGSSEDPYPEQNKSEETKEKVEQGDPSNVLILSDTITATRNSILFNQFSMILLVNQSHAKRIGQLVKSCQSEACGQAGLTQILKSTITGQGSIIVNGNSYTAENIINEIMNSTAQDESSESQPDYDLLF